MMPKGVEHLLISPSQTTKSTVRIPMMPKGVEHPTGAFVLNPDAGSENSDDAERR